MGAVALGLPGRRVDRSGVTSEQAGHLADVLRRTVGGQVRFDAGSRAAYATDGSNYRQVPIGVVLPRDTADVEATLAACRQVGAPVLGRGGGTSLAGQGCNVAVVIDFSRYLNRVLELDPAARTARVQPGVVLDRLRDAAEVHGLTFGPDPATHTHCTLGGMIGNNSCGVHALYAGTTVDNVDALEVLLYDGTRLRPGRGADTVPEPYRTHLTELAGRYGDLVRERYPWIPRRVSGFNLDELLPERGVHVARSLVGTESTCALTLEATVRLVASPRHRRLVVLGYPDIFVAGDQVPSLLEHSPYGLEGFDSGLVADMRAAGLNTADLDVLPPGGGWLLVELGADEPGELDARVGRLERSLRAQPGTPQILVVTDRARERSFWRTRESALGATAHVPGQAPRHEGWEDSAVDPARIGDYLREITAMWQEFGYHGSWYGHIGQGCVHTRNDFDLATPGGVATYRRYVEAAADLCVSYGGSLSGEHGDGQARGELLGRMFGPELVGAFGAFKAVWDPAGRMNPGKVVDPYPLDTNLRSTPVDLGPTHFAFPADGGSLAAASERCVGVGKCRRTDGGLMCPSYMATGEELHSTRGRARVLREVLTAAADGPPTRGGWRDPALRDALDLCLSCKGCRTDCPVSVDMATYKAEFLAHHYARRLRPPAAYALGLIHRWARLAVRAPRLANLVAGSPLRRLAGVTLRRPAPAFARQTFRSWFGARPDRPPGDPVVLFADTFTDTLSPHVARAAVAVLEDAGLRVTVPAGSLCCGRPLYDYGMLTTATRLLRSVLTALGPALDAGHPIVVLEPSCLAVFRDELVGLLPDDPAARRLSRQAVSLAELLVARGYAPPAAGDGRPALVQAHCHQASVVGVDADLALMRAAGLSPELLDAGCCGLAGSFGFEAGHYDLSMRIGERALLPRVRAAAPGTLVLADGWSCSHQIEHGTGRRALHLAEVLAAALPRP